MVATLILILILVNLFHDDYIYKSTGCSNLVVAAWVAQRQVLAMKTILKRTRRN